MIASGGLQGPAKVPADVTPCGRGSRPFVSGRSPFTSDSLEGRPLKGHALGNPSPTDSCTRFGELVDSGKLKETVP